ncbi:hypothetical protein JW707_01015 [Candidatus Woesearchaeota archaeon]|nr:hypothetical protein [Candidatus Woesearchaeota archaeon]
MVKKELLNWIKSEEAEGYSARKLSKYLAEKGYSKDDIKEAMEMAEKEGAGASAGKTGKPSKRIYKYLAAAVIVLLVFYGVMFYLTHKPGNKEEVAPYTGEIPEELPLINITPPEGREQPTGEEIPAEPENLTIDMLAT